MKKNEITLRTQNEATIKTVARVEDYRLQFIIGNRACRARTATKIVFTDGTEIRFTEKMSRKRALAQFGDPLGYILPLEDLLSKAP